MFCRPRLVVCVLVAACTHAHGPTTPRTTGVPTPAIAVGSCGDPGHDGVVGSSPRLERADRDLDGDGKPEVVVVDRALCSPEGNCYWNAFAQPPWQCARYLGTVEGAALEALQSRGDDNMSDVRAYWKQSGGRLLLQSYRYARGGYRIDDVLQCKRDADDRIECADEGR